MRPSAILLSLTCFALLGDIATAQNIRIATWNVEHLGSPGRGFGGGFGGGTLPLRTNQQLDDIADFIKDDLELDLVALQEVAITDFEGDMPICEPLNRIIERLNSDGSDWDYVIATPDDTDIEDDFTNIHCAFLFDRNRCRPRTVFTYEVQNLSAGRTRLFDRRPLIGCFDVINDGVTMNDFAIANVHFASGQENDEAHLAALIILEQSFGALLRAKSIRESDQIIVGDMNDNPNNSDLLFGYLEHRNFRPLVTADSPATRLNNNLTSVIDNVYINNSADGEIPTDRATVFRPENSDPDGLAEFRRDFSDHVPVIFEVVIREDNDVD